MFSANPTYIPAYLTIYLTLYVTIVCSYAILTLTSPSSLNVEQIYFLIFWAMSNLPIYTPQLMCNSPIPQDWFMHRSPAFVFLKVNMYESEHVCFNRHYLCSCLSHWPAGTRLGRNNRLCHWIRHIHDHRQDSYDHTIAVLNRNVTSQFHITVKTYIKELNFRVTHVY